MGRNWRRRRIVCARTHHPVVRVGRVVCLRALFWWRRLQRGGIKEYNVCLLARSRCLEKAPAPRRVRFPQYSEVRCCTLERASTPLIMGRQPCGALHDTWGSNQAVTCEVSSSASAVS